MTNPLHALTTALAFAVIALVAPPLLAEPAREHVLGRKVEDFVLPNVITGEPWRLSEQNARAIVLYFNSTECPVTNRYIPSLRRMHRELIDDNVMVVAVNSNQHDTEEEMRKHANEYELEIPVLCDATGIVARMLAASRTAEAFVLDHRLRVRYRGVIDDRFERGVTRPKATATFLADAVSAVLAGRSVKTPITDVEACPLHLAPAVAESPPHNTVTYSEHAAAIIQRRCQSCHRPGAIGPFELMNYDDAKSWSSSIREVVTSGLMPPWHADAPHGHFVNDRRLTDEEYETLLDWIDGGTLKGDPSKLPEPRAFPKSWSIGDPDLVIPMEKAIKVPAETPELGVPYKYVWGGSPFEHDAWVTAAEVHPGAADVVHHASVYIVPDGTRIELVEDERPTGLVAELTSPINSLPHLVSFVPGDNAFIRRAGLAMRIPKGARLLFEMHYTPTGKEAVDCTEVGLRFTSTPPRHEVHSSAVLNYWFTIPPRAANHQVQAKTPRFKRDSILLTMNPHMHYRGKSFKYELIKPSGERSLLLNVPRYRFDWQSTYVLSEPIEIPAGSRIACTAVFDNSEDNPFNPDPTVRVQWGEQTWQEMMLAGFEYYEK